MAHDPHERRFAGSPVAITRFLFDGSHYQFAHTVPVD
jgi:hypothetical protein